MCNRFRSAKHRGGRYREQDEHMQSKDIWVDVVLMENRWKKLFWYGDHVSRVTKIVCYDQFNIVVNVKPL